MKKSILIVIPILSFLSCEQEFLTICECAEKKIEFVDKNFDESWLDADYDHCEVQIEFIKKNPSCLESHIENTTPEEMMPADYLQQYCPEVVIRQEQLRKEKMGESLPDY